MTEKAPVPLLLLSDAPSSGTGLGRITRDLAIRIHEHLGDLYRVATLGYGSAGSCRLPFFQYTIEGMDEWIVKTLPEVWEDFAGKEKGVCMPIWDLSRLMWFAQPARCEMLASYPSLREWLLKAPFQRWGYFPIDANGPNDKLSFPLHQTLLGFNRILAYTGWAEQIIERTIGKDESKNLHLTNHPHGIDTGVFYPRERTRCRFRFGFITGARTLIKAPQLSSVLAHEVLIGVVATNQFRKDWALAIETAAWIAKRHRVRLWIHIDELERQWSIPALLADHNLLDKTIISIGYLPDDSMAMAYSACDLTLAPGLGEGFGFPIFESLACGTPCIHGNYGGAPEWMPPEYLIEPVAYRYEGLYSCQRPVFRVQDWAAKAEFLLENVSRAGVKLNEALDWNNLWSRWEPWFREGLAAA